jgi:predicted nucleic acid-binding protein
MAKILRRYWDSSCFLAWLKPEPARHNACHDVLKAAERGEVVLVTSTITLTEVIKLNKGPIQIPQEAERQISGFFKHEYIVLVQVTRFIAEAARSLMWAYPDLRPKDAIHAATAMKSGVFDLHTFDKDFLPLDGTVGSGATGLRIAEPHMPQKSLTFDTPPDPDPEDDEQPNVN